MSQPSDTPVNDHQHAHCRHCYAGIERREGGFWTHRRSRSARCVPGSPRNAQLADARPGTVVAVR